jgi:hypothetical protein
VTAHAMAGDRDRYLAAGFDATSRSRSLTDQVLIDAIETLLARRPRGGHGT